MNVSIKRSNDKYRVLDIEEALLILESCIFYKNIRPILINEELDLNIFKEIMDRNIFVTYDILIIDSKQDVKQEFHSHPDIEARWTIDGYANFYIYHNDEIYKLEVEKGDFLIINSGIVHCYLYKSSINSYHNVVRFFNKSLTGWSDIM